jgi:2-C-methyl-D-erythritol 2,4-cyclodiphosphate synthase
MRAGIGYDIHPFAPGRPLVLGGVTIPHDAGLGGHSDGDALCHAVIDALLGAAAQGDIGSHFPPGDPRYAGISSLQLLHETVELIRERFYRVVNVDATVVLERPRLAPHTDEMRATLAGALGIPVADVSVKAKTADGLGALGRGEGVAALAVALLDST